MHWRQRLPLQAHTAVVLRTSDTKPHNPQLGYATHRCGGHIGAWLCLTPNFTRRAKMFDERGLIVSPLAMQSFAAEAYAASPAYGPLSLPWYADFVHLVFWFFFLTILVLCVWLAQAFAFVTRGGEARSPIRETRGFSRAQTGDTLTAIIPLAWSITMLLQASTHSSNFDENTDNTSLSLTIIAYQWGWSYFFPLDAVRALGSTSGAQWVPTTRLVGRGLTDAAVNVDVAAALNTNVVADVTVEAVWPNVEAWSDVISPVVSTNCVMGVDAPQPLALQTGKHTTTPQLPRLLDDVDMSFYALVRGCEFGTTRQPAPASLVPSWGGGLARRMHVTAGLALPSDTPIHVTCGSKDVIHSWAIPGLLIKIDCIPGYNVHRRLLVRWRGLFWGQCMEVCGRYHHWMPLLVYVSHADTFAAWLVANDA